MSFVRVQAMTPEIRCASGEKRESGFDVVNATDRPLRVGIEPIGPAKDWVHVDASLLEVSLPPRGQQKVKISFEAPSSASGTQSSFKLRVYRLDDPSVAIESADVGIQVTAIEVPRTAPQTLAPQVPAQKVPWAIIAGAVGLVIAIGVISAVVLRPSRVPDLMGKQQDEALKLLTDADLTPKLSERITGAAAAGSVIDQVPKAGEPVPENETIEVVVEQQPVIAYAPPVYQPPLTLLPSQPVTPEWQRSGFRPVLALTVHQQNLGDQGGAEDQWVGVRAQSLRLEGFSLALRRAGVPGLGIEYMCHVENAGDTPWLGGGAFCGTRGQNRRIEGFAVRLTGPNASLFTVRYFCHLQDLGDSGPLADGAYCGTRGQNRRLESMLVSIVLRSDVRVRTNRI